MPARAFNYYHKQAEPQNRFTIMHKKKNTLSGYDNIHSTYI